jgi:hypothetical protein
MTQEHPERSRREQGFELSIPHPRVLMASGAVRLLLVIAFLVVAGIGISKVRSSRSVSEVAAPPVSVEPQTSAPRPVQQQLLGYFRSTAEREIVKVMESHTFSTSARSFVLSAPLNGGRWLRRLVALAYGRIC